MAIMSEVNPKINVGDAAIEIVERKGTGHPDSLADSCAALLSMLYSNYCIKHFDRILHHNFDKVTIAGGRSEALFGDGKIIDPAEILFVGRGITSFGNKSVPIAKMAEEVAKIISVNNVGTGFKFKSDSRWIKQGSVDLVTNFDEQGVPRANDTSFATAWAPLTELEDKVLSIEKFLNGDYRIQNKFVGTDIKIMGRRIIDDVIINIAVAFVAPEISSLSDYMEAKKKIAEDVSKKFGIPVHNIYVNTADEPEKEIVYLTVSGTSAECGDDGGIGRGNRITGLIAPARPNTLEAIAGKNPNKHVGNFYNVWAKKIANNIWHKFNVMNDVQLVSTIGKPITECDVFVRTADEVKKDDIEDAVKNVVESYEKITKEIISGKIDMYPYDLGNKLLIPLLKGFDIG